MALLAYFYWARAILLLIEMARFHTLLAVSLENYILIKLFAGMWTKMWSSSTCK